MKHNCFISVGFFSEPCRKCLAGDVLSLASEEAPPQLVAKVFLRLAEVFRADDSNRVRVWVVWLFTASPRECQTKGE